MTDDTSQARRRPTATSAVLIALLAVTVGIGIWQDREPDAIGSGETGMASMVAQVLPASEDLAALPTAPEPGALTPNFRLQLADGGEIELAELHGARQMPTSVFVDRDGVVSSILYGVIVPDQMRTHIDAMLGDATAERLSDGHRVKG